MAQEWLEVVSARAERAKLHRLSIDGIPSQRYASDAVIGRLHYPSVLDSEVHDTELDLTPQRVDNPQFDGWRVEQNSWHYALGKDLASHGDEDGWLGFGGRQGRHWFKFRLLRLGYLHWPTRAWQDVGGAPDYNRARLSQETLLTEFPVVGTSIPTATRATWERIWSTPGGGRLDVSWVAGGYGLKEEIRINQAGRTWIAANRPPSTPAAETWFGVAFELDWSDIPRIYRQGVLQGPDTDFADDDESIELRDALDRLLAFMPVSEAYVEFLDAEDNPAREVVPLRKRFWHEGGKHFLLVGARVPELNTMPAGDLIFDPDIDEQIGASSDDAQQDVAVVTIATGQIDMWQTGDGGGWRWTGVGVPDGATIDAAHVEIYCPDGLDDELGAKNWGCEDGNNPGTFTTNNNDLSDRAMTAARFYSAGAAATPNWNTIGDDPGEFDACIQEVVDDNAGTGDALVVLCWSESSGDLSVTAWDGNSALAAKLHIEYTEGGIILTPTPASVMLVATDPVVGLTLSLTPTPATIPIVAADPTVVFALLILTPTPATIPIVAADPTLALTLGLTPTPATIPIVAVDPAIGLGVLSLTPTPATIPITAVDPAVGLVLTLTPTPATVPIVAADPAVGLTLSLTPTPAAIPIVVADPAIGLGVLTLTPTPASIPIIVADPAVGLTLVISPTPATIPILAPAVTIGTGIVLTPTPAVIPIVVADPAIGLGVLTISPTPATIPIVAASPTVVRILILTPTPATIPLLAPALTLSHILTLTPPATAIPLVVPDPAVGLAFTPILLDLGPRGFVLWLLPRQFEMELTPRDFEMDLEDR